MAILIKVEKEVVAEVNVKLGVQERKENQSKF